MMDQHEQPNADPGRATAQGDDSVLQQGQASAADAGLSQADILAQEQRQGGQSTVAQRSGGQEANGADADDDSFAGSSFAGQTGGGDAIIGRAHEDSSVDYVRADHGEEDGESELDGQ